MKREGHSNALALTQFNGERNLYWVKIIFHVKEKIYKLFKSNDLVEMEDHEKVT